MKRSPGHRARLLAGVIAPLTFAGSGCSGPAQIRYEEQLQTTPPPGRHAIHSVRLEQHMRGLERLAVERLPQALDAREAESRRKAELVEVARAMADSVSRIADAAQAVELDAAERREFLALADVLRQRAQQLAEEAPDLSLDELRARASALDASCAACHDRFRIREPADAG